MMDTLDYRTPNECNLIEESSCRSGTLPTNYADRYGDSSATWVMVCAILMFFMKAGFLYMEQSFSDSDCELRRRVVLAKYVDTFASTIGFWLFGYAVSGSTSGYVVGERQDYIFWFFRFTFASNTATILGGTLVGQNIHMRITSVFIYAFVMSSFIHPPLARWVWSTGRNENLMFSPFRFCNGTRTVEKDHRFSYYPDGEDLGDFVFLDFAGSGVVHLCGGMAALVLEIFHKVEKKITDRSWNTCCKRLKHQLEIALNFKLPVIRAKLDDCKHRRSINDHEGYLEVEGDNNRRTFIGWMYPLSGGEEFLESATLGVLILWTTWFGFNAGSTESIEGKLAHATVGRIALVMSLAAASGGLTSTIIAGLVQLNRNTKSKTNTNEIANGMLACLVAVTGCCPFIDPPWAILIGVLTIFFYHLGCYIVYIFDLHDGARILPVHGICGFWGVLCVGIFSRNCLIEEVYETACFCTELNLPEKLETQGLRFLYQFAGGLFIAIWSVILCTVLFLVLWLLPAKRIMNNCVTRKFCVKERLDDFKGNMLFAHFPVPDRPRV